MALGALARSLIATGVLSYAGIINLKKRGPNVTLQTLTATYRITTPMFCSGANQQNAELRLASFKGALRFWWRSLMWAETQDVQKLWKKEGELFGSTEHGQSKVRMRLVDFKPVEEGNRFQWAQLRGCQYLGYGVMNVRGQLTRPMIPGGTFTVDVLPHPKVSAEQFEYLRKALILLGTVGGLGSKARKGFGSLTLTALEGEAAGPLPDDIESRLQKCLPTSLPAEPPEWTAWSEESKVVRAHLPNASAINLLDALGREMVHYRSWGNNGKVLGIDREGNFQQDHDLMAQPEAARTHPERIAFGLPHNYFFSSTKESYGVQPANKNRRASPLFLHIHQQDSGSTPLGVVSFLPARFLAEEEKIKVHQNTVDVQEHDFWQPVHGYLHRLIGKKGATEKKTGVIGEEVSVG
jgi:CRISPR-associated protein Cmr1